ncbi:hypothetical protein LSTR_LSTR001382 [Laodelphax striatellus]|uniref:Uncharacterized protein n=1 Tax=Laodelphax striatellus TaxID=195883 RepID=A0A482XA77_LAOST|nr:hypothetical protein LSTR_LSTR001382 [Laodelphax striatellus]
MSRCCLLLISSLVVTCLVHAKPQAPAPAPAPAEAPMPYQYEYKVENQTQNLYFTKNEQGNEAGRVEGGYEVLLPDGRLMKVTYYVDGDSGFVPKIEFEENANPFGK